MSSQVSIPVPAMGEKHQRISKKIEDQQSDTRASTRFDIQSQQPHTGW